MRTNPLHPRACLLMLLCAAVASLAGCHRGSAPASPRPDEVNVGYGTRPADDLTGAVSSSSGEELDRRQTRRLEELLEGRFPGVQVIRQPDGELSVRIRGTGSLLGDEEPLLVVDGVPMQGISRGLRSLNPNDVERIDVLRDAASTAIYGTRGGNGVIVITTRRSR